MLIISYAFHCYDKMPYINQFKGGITWAHSFSNFNMSLVDSLALGFHETNGVAGGGRFVFKYFLQGYFHNDVTSSQLALPFKDLPSLLEP